MPNKRKITQKKPLYGNNRPFSLKATRKHQDPNLQWKRIYVPKLGKTVRVKVSTKEMRTIDKIGLEKFLRRQGRTLESVVRES
jgi:large subunit ribosomal protein L28